MQNEKKWRDWQKKEMHSKKSAKNMEQVRQEVLGQ
jgi:hypothetical protein